MADTTSSLIREPNWRQQQPDDACPLRSITNAIGIWKRSRNSLAPLSSCWFLRVISDDDGVILRLNLLLHPSVLEQRCTVVAKSNNRPKGIILGTVRSDGINSNAFLDQGPLVETGKNTSIVIPASRKRRQKGNPVVSDETLMYGYESSATLTTGIALQITDPSSRHKVPVWRRVRILTP
jgi:hypothetical protein